MGQIVGTRARNERMANSHHSRAIGSVRRLCAGSAERAVNPIIRPSTACVARVETDGTSAAPRLLHASDGAGCVC